MNKTIMLAALTVCGASAQTTVPLALDGDCDLYVATAQGIAVHCLHSFPGSSKTPR